MEKRHYCVKGVIFDWNGTLSDDIRRVFAVAMKTVKKTGGKPLRSIREFRRTVQNPWLFFYKGLGCTSGKSEIYKWYCYYLKREKTPAKLSPGAAGILKFLSGRNIKIGIVSSHPTSAIKAEAMRYRIARYFDMIKGDVHVKGYHLKLFLKRYSLEPKEVIFVGDMANDIEEGKKCGVITAAYLKGANTKARLLAEKPDVVLQSLSALRKLF